MLPMFINLRSKLSMGKFEMLDLLSGQALPCSRFWALAR